VEQQDIAAPAAERARVVRAARIAAVVVLVLLAVGAGRTILGRIANARILDAGVSESATPYVKTTVVRSSEGSQSLALPGTLQGFQQAPLAARAAGYVRRWTKDIGSHVAQGELLPDRAPEIDQQLRRPRRAPAGRGSSRSRAARSTLESLRAKTSSRSRTRRAAQRRGAGGGEPARRRRQRPAAATAAGFTRVVAPFDGVITRRSVEVGDLVVSSGKALFVLTQMDPLRVYVNVPQAYAQLVRPGQKVVVTQAELRGQTFTGEVARTAASIDPATRTMQVEITLPNRAGALLPGAYVQVELPLAGSTTLLVPTSVLLFRGEGTRVAALDAANRVHLKSVTLGRNLGESIEVLDGIAAGERLVVNPADSLAEGDSVAVVALDDSAASGVRGRPAAPKSLQ
jgi:RND family efflux transporter MFP subunit